MGIIEKQSVQDIANAIRNRNGLTTLYKPREMDEAILNLYSTTKVNSMLDYILPCYEKEATDYTIKYADSDRPGSITQLQGNTTQNGTPTPTNPIPIYTVSGDNEVVVCGTNFLDIEKIKTQTWKNEVYRGTRLNDINSKGTWCFKAQLKEGKTAISGLYVAIAQTINPNASTNALSIKNGVVQTSTKTFTGTDLYISFYPTFHTIEEITEVYDLWISKSDTEYEPYQGNSYRVDLGGDNLLPQDKYIASTEVNGITYTNNGDGTFSLSGTATATTSIRIIPVGDLSLKTSQAYYLYSSQAYNSTSFNMSIALNDSGTNRYLTANGTLSTPSSFTQARLQFYIASGNTVNVQNIKLMLVEGNTAPSRYSPYVSNPIELCKVDTIFKAETGNPTYDSLDDTTKASLTYGNWYIEKNIGKVVLNGSESSWVENSATKGLFQVTLQDNIYANNSTKNALCNMLQPTTGTNIVSTSFYLDNSISTFSNNRLFFRLNSYANNLAGLKTFITTNNLVCYYVLSTPTYETITNENLIQQLNNIQDMQLIENLCCVDWVGEEKPTMKLFCYLDKDKIIEEITG